MNTVGAREPCDIGPVVDEERNTSRTTQRREVART
jgi:hypothetical protein